MMRKRDKQAGFTLLELLAVILMIGLVAGAMIYSFRRGDRLKRVNLSKDGLINTIRTAQNFALSGKQIPPTGQQGVTFARGNPRCPSDNSAVSYWVEIRNNAEPYYEILAEDRCGAVMRMQLDSLTTDVRFTAPTLAPPFQIVTSGGTTNPNSFAVRFSPPFGAMTASGVLAPLPSQFSSFRTATISLSNWDRANLKSLTIDGISGKIQ